jgi:hypothetical protein
MATRGRKQTAWALQIKNIAETLQPHMAEKTHQEAKLWHPKPPACTKLLHITLHWENRRTSAPLDANSKPAWEMQTKRSGTERAPSGIMGRWKRDGNHSPPKNKLVQNSEGNEENGYLVPDSNKTNTDYPKEPSEAHKNILKEEILQKITENFMEMLLDKVNQNVQGHSRNSKTTKIKNMRRHKNK